MLITNKGNEINLLIEVANVCLLGILLERTKKKKNMYDAEISELFVSIDVSGACFFLLNIKYNFYFSLMLNST